MDVPTAATPVPPAGWTGVTDDSRHVEPGYAFVAIAGETHDGHCFIPDAVRRGASCLYVERDLPMAVDVPTFRVASTRAALADLASSFYGNPAQQLHCIGATGTNGKTTTTTLLQWILNYRRQKAGLIGTVVTDSGRAVRYSHLTTPDPVVIHSALAEMVTNDLDYAVLEVSSHGLKQERAHGITFDAAIFTNISLDHLDYHSSFEEYIASKARLFRSLPTYGAAIINRDDPVSSTMAGSSMAPVYTYGLDMQGYENPLDAHGVHVRPSSDGWRVRVSLSAHLKAIHCATRRSLGHDFKPPADELRLTIPQLGIHNVSNVLAAVTAALLLGAPVEDIAGGVANFPGVWRRQQLLPVSGPSVIDDACHNPSSFEALFDTVESLPCRRVFMVNAIRGNRGSEVNRTNSRALARWASRRDDFRLWVTDCEETAETRDIVTDEERKAFLAELDRCDVPYIHRYDLNSCLHDLAATLRPGDLGLLTGAHAMDRAAQRFLAIWNRQSGSQETRPAPSRPEPVTALTSAG